MTTRQRHSRGCSDRQLFSGSLWTMVSELRGSSPISKVWPSSKLPKCVFTGSQCPYGHCIFFLLKSHHRGQEFAWRKRNARFLYLVVHLLGAVEDIHHDPQSPPQVLGGLCLARPGWTCRSTAHGQVEGLRQGDVAAVSQGGDHQTCRVAKVLVGVPELCIADVGITMPLRVGPSAQTAMAKDTRFLTFTIWLPNLFNYHCQTSKPHVPPIM